MRFGSIQFHSGGSSQLTRRILNHPNFHSRNLHNDVSLLQERAALSLKNAQNVIRLPRGAHQSESFQGRTGAISGWGSVVNNGPSQNLLRWANVCIIPHSECRGIYGSTFIVDHVMCSSGSSRNQGVCSGDKGGPLDVNEGGISTQIDVMSFNAGRLWGNGCTANRPSGYMRASHFLVWINQITNIAIRP